MTFLSLLPQTLRRRRRRARPAVEVDKRLGVTGVVAVVLRLVHAIATLVSTTVLVYGQRQQQQYHDDRSNDADDHGDAGRQRTDPVLCPSPGLLRRRRRRLVGRGGPRRRGRDHRVGSTGAKQGLGRMIGHD